MLPVTHTSTDFKNKMLGERSKTNGMDRKIPRISFLKMHTQKALTLLMDTQVYAYYSAEGSTEISLDITEAWKSEKWERWDPTRRRHC